MGSWVRDLYAIRQNPTDFMLSSHTNIIEGTVIIREATASNAGEAMIGTTTAALNALGCAQALDTYSATQGAHGELPAMVRTLPTPFSIWKFRVSGSSTKGAALSAASGGQILTNTAASTSGLVVTDANAVTDMSGGIIKGRSGANKGSIRKQTTLNSGVDTNVVVPFPFDIAVGDTFIRLPYSRAAIAVQMVATSIDEADGAIAFGTGIPFNVDEVMVNEDTDEAWVYGCFRTHFHNSLA